MPKFDPADQISLLCDQSQVIGEVLYKEYALYLQVLREELLAVVRQTIFSLITHRGQNLLEQLAPEMRASFQSQVEKLVGRCCALLTVEQLMDLARQMEKEQELKQEEARREFLASMKTPASFLEEPEGSVNLSLSPPLENPERFKGSFIDSDKENSKRSNFDFDLSDDALGTSQSIEEEMIDLKKSYGPERENIQMEEGREEDRQGFDVLRSLFAMAGDVIGSEKSSSNRDQKPLISDSSIGNELKEVDEGFLPENPSELAAWVESLELALSRRLRNLSHALNVEMLRVGIVNSLLPIGLLDTALEGRLDSQHVAPNLLTLHIPVQNQLLEGGMEVVCVLLRTSELEFACPQLRRCRLQLKQRHTQLIKMVRQYRHWQGRFKSKEAHQQWWKTSSAEQMGGVGEH